MVSYDRDEVQLPKRLSRSPRRVGSAEPKPRENRPETTVNYEYLSVREGIKVVTEDYTTPVSI